MQISLAAGSYTASFTTYDGPLVGGVPSGNPLSASLALPVTIAANALTTLNVTLQGLPTSLAVLPDNGSAVTLSGA